MKFEIKNFFTGNVQATVEIAAEFEDASASFKLGAAVQAAYKTGADLTGADLTGAYLTGADLTGADLTGADLTGADLTGAYLKGADLTGADLTGAYLTGADLTGADLTGAYLKGAYLKGAYLKGAYLTGAYLKGAVGLSEAHGEPMKHATPEESIANLDKVREIVMDNAERLDMGLWHNGTEWVNRTCAEEATCGTSHCLAGWLQVCATDETVRTMYDPHLAGIVQAPVAAKMFFRDAPEVLAWIKDRKYADEAKEYV